MLLLLWKLQIRNTCINIFLISPLLILVPALRIIEGNEVTASFCTFNAVVYQTLFIVITNEIKFAQLIGCSLSSDTLVIIVTKVNRRAPRSESLWKYVISPDQADGGILRYLPLWSMGIARLLISQAVNCTTFLGKSSPLSFTTVQFLLLLQT